MRPLPLRNYLAEAKICNLDMPIDIYKYVLWLYVSIHNIQVMQILQAFKHFSKVELGLFFSKLLDLAEMEEHFTAGADVHNEE